MDFLDGPDIELWNERKKWIEEKMDVDSEWGGYALSEQGCALMMDLEVIFCAGAWVAVICLSMSIIDAQLREVEVPGFQGNTEKLIKTAGLTDEFDWFRKRRNKLIHLNPDRPEITVDDQWGKREELESEARKAIELVFKAMFLTPFV
jgi:hypothetical protein